MRGFCSDAILHYTSPDEIREVYCEIFGASTSEGDRNVSSRVSHRFRMLTMGSGANPVFLAYMESSHKLKL